MPAHERASGSLWARGIHYFDVAFALTGLLLIGGRILGPDPIVRVWRDLAGTRAPLVALALLVTFRRRARAQETPWLASLIIALALVAIGGVYWRWSVMAFMTPASLPHCCCLQDWCCGRDGSWNRSCAPIGSP